MRRSRSDARSGALSDLADSAARIANAAYIANRHMLRVPRCGRNRFRMDIVDEPAARASRSAERKKRDARRIPGAPRDRSSRGSRNGLDRLSDRVAGRAPSAFVA
ncbi:hypothetical protein AQ879_05340 [Burkholderia pseudomallei]|uniref:hypothetical protein n=1 Tax=Burkholderia pseudomallei TaxID=28450 RepID=UPI0001A48873|nr:conserved hypothetical protein [Burkholderia pseudomallei MSHR346]OMW28756.1 hypothetical protein AQ807_19570 [Burkholderia pseudomallei]ONA27963.1 hypothetical protein AQ879_05340 [Burkholderia pseudomallei]ONA32120.1 hypothetical protein AQ880_11430 [Burkholderia pseudomallei]ONA41975.1 hypothetical protein AQ881_09260 [Burkholderia pseudomallei]